MKNLNQETGPLFDKIMGFKLYQKRDEFCSLLELIKAEAIKKQNLARDPKAARYNILEIGCYSGATAGMFAQYADTVIGIDLFNPIMGCDNIKYIVGSSHEPETYEAVKSSMENRFINFFDFIFIDGDHSEGGSYRDFAIYKNLLSPVGMIAFHDIVSSDHHREQGCEVDKAWRQAKDEVINNGGGSMEIVSTNEAHWGGIGVLFMAGK